MSSPMAALPIFHARRVCHWTKDGELWRFAHAALHLGESGEAGQGRDGLPERKGIFVGRYPANDRPKERQPVRRLEGDDGGADIAPGAGQGQFGFVFEKLIPRGVVGRSGELGVEPGSREAGLNGFDRAERLPGGVTLALFDAEVAIAECCVQRAERLGPELITNLGRNPQHAQPGGVAVLVASGKLGVVVLGLVDKSQADEAPFDRIVGLGDNLLDPSRCNPGERAYGVEEELDIGARSSHWLNVSAKQGGRDALGSHRPRLSRESRCMVGITHPLKGMAPVLGLSSLVHGGLETRISLALCEETRYPISM